MPAVWPSAEALASLKRYQRVFISLLPKAELHAHLNGCIPLETLRELAKDYAPPEGSPIVDLTALASGVELKEIHDFFKLFPAIYAITATPDALRIATVAVVEQFIGMEPDARAQGCAYLELRTTPRETATMTRRVYLETVLDVLERYPAGRAGLLVSVSREMEESVVQEVIDTAIALKDEGRRVVGVDLCGQPLHLARAKEAGLRLTVHVAEPDRLGHATFLNEEARQFVEANRIPIEICLSSNLLCKTAPTIDDHHVKHWILKDHPVAICTDDTLVFKSTLAGEYALLMAAPPLGLGLSESQIESIAKGGLDSSFGPKPHVEANGTS
ncbi:Metallo-dependent hydrolase [Auriculariales sp. MPI-PUGE-AT-0066]|nr:Metallo-dependent hydrolase [Auriculariales sp. MPI-PUGE-AT-0066]